MDKRTKWTIGRKKKLIEALRTTDKSLNELAIEFGTNHTLLYKKIKELGFVKKTIYVWENRI